MEQNAQKSFDSFIAVLEDTAQLVGDIADIESAKAEAASLNQHHLLDGYIQTEQAQILKLRGLEQRRARFAGDRWVGLSHLPADPCCGAAVSAKRSPASV